MTTAAQGRTGRPRIQTQDNVVAHAIAVVNEHGAAGLTMSALARRLGVSTMTLYGYVPSREGLVDLVVARLLDEQPALPALLPETWIDQLVMYMDDIRSWALARPALFHLNKERPNLTEDVARHVQTDLDALTQLGFSAGDALALRHALTVLLHGQLEFDLRRREPASPAHPRALPEGLAHLQRTDMTNLYSTAVRALLVGFAPRVSAR